jgi:hypothetical protein
LNSIEDKTEKLITDFVNQNPGCDEMKIISYIIKFTDLGHDQLTKIINQMGFSQELVAIHYTLPNMGNQEKILYFPKGTQIYT